MERNEFELSVSVSKPSDDSIKLCDIKMSCEARPPPARICSAIEQGVDLMTEKTKSENPALEPEAEAKILARKTLELLRL